MVNAEESGMVTVLAYFKTLHRHAPGRTEAKIRTVHCQQCPHPLYDLQFLVCNFMSILCIIRSQYNSVA
jgi:hypothetical protein